VGVVFANNGDFDAYRPRLARYHRGVDDTTVVAALEALHTLYADVGRPRHGSPSSERRKSPRADVARCSDSCRADVLTHHRGQCGFTIGRNEFGEQARVRLRVERVAQLGHGEEHLKPSCYLL
jgi:DNA segregation ATPase FtsK/SpoIIIE, S-DNA-T family